MAYKRKEIFEKAQNAIKKNPLLFIEDIVAFLPCDKSTFYRLFPTKCYEYHTLKEMLEENRVKMKTDMRKVWFKSTNPSLQIALMKIICSDEEAHRLNGSSMKADITSGGKEISQIGSSTITVNIVKPLDYDDDEYSDPE